MTCGGRVPRSALGVAVDFLCGHRETQNAKPEAERSNHPPHASEAICYPRALRKSPGYGIALGYKASQPPAAWRGHAVRAGSAPRFGLELVHPDRARSRIHRGDALGHALFARGARPGASRDFSP